MERFFRLNRRAGKPKSTLKTLTATETAADPFHLVCSFQAAVILSFIVNNACRVSSFRPNFPAKNTWRRTNPSPAFPNRSDGASPEELWIEHSPTADLRTETKQNPPLLTLLRWALYCSGVLLVFFRDIVGESVLQPLVPTPRRFRSFIHMPERLVHVHLHERVVKFR